MGKKKLLCVEDVIKQIEKEHPNDLQFALNSHSDVKGKLFRDCGLLYKALRFLCTTYVNSRRGVVLCKDLVKACKEECGCDLLLHYPYKTHYKGRTLELHSHLKKGWWKQKHSHIHVAFEYLEDRQIVVVGQIS